MFHLSDPGKHQKFPGIGLGVLQVTGASAGLILPGVEPGLEQIRPAAFRSGSLS